MKRTIMVLVGLIALFLFTWSVRVRTAINPPEQVSADNEIAWYEARYTAPKANEDWMLDPEIPENYVPVPGEEELYMVVDDSGTIINYRQRSKRADGSWCWADVTDPDLAFTIEAMEGIENLYRIEDENDVITYMKYVRNPDNTYAYVDTDESGRALDAGTNADEISDDYYLFQDNIYALYNENSVLIGYRQRLQNENGSFYWAELEMPSYTGLVSLNDILDGTIITNEAAEQPVVSDVPTTTYEGTYTVTKSNTETVTEDGYSVVYQTTVYYTYDQDGTLLETRKEGPTELSRTQIGTGQMTPNRNLIASTLDGELARVSANVTYNTDKADEVLALLNAARVAQGKSALTMNHGSESYKTACIKAADMAVYGYCATESPLYGTLEDLINRYNIATDNPSENIWKAGEKTADEIHSRFQSNTDSRTVRMSDYSEVGIVVVEYGGATYVAEVFLK